MKSILKRIYGQQRGEVAFERLQAVMNSFSPEPSSGIKEPFTQADAILITYGDTLLRNGEAPLQTMDRFSCQYFKDVFSAIHILPFFPYSSDDGFSVTDFQAVRSELGSWADIRAIGKNFKLMVDVVANHVSARSRWFQSYLADEKGFCDLAIEVDPTVDLTSVMRPRTLPLLTSYKKTSGRQVSVWTTFSADQIDLNYDSLDVLEKMVRTLLFYVSQGARYIRLDAIAYLWKQIGTTCIHLPKTHDMVRLFRKILDMTAPDVMLITETNVPHDENISYFGDGTDEAQMIYNFTVPPLLLYSLVAGSSTVFSDWIRTLRSPSERTTFFNFTASHDGIGVRPLEGILPSSDIDELADRIRKNGGYISEKKNPDGTTSPYEMNITYLDALKNPDDPEDPYHVLRFLASQAVVLALPGVPGVYLHSLLGSGNWAEGVRKTGMARTINRRRFSADDVGKELSDFQHIRAQVFHPYLRMVRIRARQPAFHPLAGMDIVNIDHRVFGVRRSCPEQTLFALTNFSTDTLIVSLPGVTGYSIFTDLLSKNRFTAGAISIAAYETRWLIPEKMSVIPTAKSACGD